MKKTHVQGHLAMLVFSFVIAGSFSMGADIAHLVPPDALTTMRFFLAAIFMGVLSYGINPWQKSHFQAIWRFPFLGMIFAIYFVAMFEALKTSSPVATATVATLIPLFTAGFGYILLKQITTKRIMVALLIGAIGTLWVIFRGSLTALLSFDVGRGELIFLLGAVAHALYTPLYGRLNRNEPLIFSTFGVLLGGGLALLPYSFDNVIVTDWVSLPLQFWLVFLYLAFITSALTFFLVQYAVQRLPSAKVMAYTYLVPSWVILWAWMFGKSLPDKILLIGVALTILALILLLKDETQEPN